MIRKLWIQIKNFKPPLVLCFIFATIFSAASLSSVATDLGKPVSPVILYCIYVCAAVFFSLTMWAILIFCRHLSLRHHFVALAHRNVLVTRILNDFSFRTIIFTYASFVLNILFALAKGVAGWVSASRWLISLSSYYLILCISKLLLLHCSHKLDKLENQILREQKEWKVYRICGILFLVMTLVLFGVVILIVTNGNQFTYDGTLIFAVAMYDFYCLTASIIYMIRTCKQHTPVIVAIKIIKFATALVSMLSLQTAMFASFGVDSDTAFKGLMNLISGSSVCVLLFSIGLIMIIQSTKKIKMFKDGEVSL